MDRVNEDLKREIVLAIENVNMNKKRCATYKDIVNIIGLSRWSPESITRAVRFLVEDGMVNRWKPSNSQKRATFFVISF